jgi:division protein CdvB (Snf7/Vps24/ESCRT-III family)
MNSLDHDMDFLKRWEEKREYPKNSKPLRPQLEEAIKIINQQTQHLDHRAARVREYDRVLFERVIAQYRAHDIRRAKIYANELAEVRKLAKQIATARLALEQIVIRLSTVKEYGDLAANVAPAVVAMKSIYGGISDMVPEADKSIIKLGDLLDGLMVEACQQVSGGNPTYATEEGEKILSQASDMAEMRLSRSLPGIPGSSSAQSKAGSHQAMKREKEPLMDGF